MFSRRFAPMFSTALDMPFVTGPRRMNVIPQDIFAILDPWAAQPRSGGKMCRRKNRKIDGKVTKPKAIERHSGNLGYYTFAEEPWETTIKAEGFKLSDFMIFVNGRTLVISGVRSEGDEESGIVKTQFKRKVAIPSDVILPTLNVDFKDGNVVVSGRRVVKEVAKDQSQKTKEMVAAMADGKVDIPKVEIPISRRSVETIAEQDSLAENSASNESDTDPPKMDINANKSECPETSKMETTECPCEDSASCTNSECLQKSNAESADTVMVENIGPEKEEDGVPVSKHDECQNVKPIDAAESHTEEVELKKTTCRSSEVVQKDTTSEVSEYKPVTWSIPLHDFDADDVSVRLEDDMIRVVAEHEEENDGMTFFRRMERSFPMPENVDPDTLSSRFCIDDHKLTIQAMPLKPTSQKSDNEDQEQPTISKNNAECKELQKDENGWTVLPISFAN